MTTVATLNGTTVEIEMVRLHPEAYIELVETDEIGPNDCPVALVYSEDFAHLPEYSCTMPTGVFYGKRWKRNMNRTSPNVPNWVIGGYDYNPEDPDNCLIKWWDVMTVDRPKKGKGKQ